MCRGVLFTNLANGLYWVISDDLGQLANNPFVHVAASDADIAKSLSAGA
jgi:hypothetical protein